MYKIPFLIILVHVNGILEEGVTVSAINNNSRIKVTQF